MSTATDATRPLTTRPPACCCYLLLQLLSPCTDGPTLETRLDCVSELLAREHVFMALAGTLPKLCDLDALLAQVRRGCG